MAADLAGGQHIIGPNADWVAPDPLKGDGRALILGARVPEGLPPDELLAITTELVRAIPEE